ncbi:hypothetical protein K493DRAFT_311123 [Basidiobolus meristosporus CBS 931.73]|uniref:Chitin synthase export chaperone n=1 Tax=Basidiobolus meristosporus CBS 931.73 TaxID=1314790 RepID=A0A1Y1Z4F1_9FUNG|nr:hypothetical protein K493DRAFT_311123 [Basidiobolus meristosporus CBS 931.73]|eukprot:ORY05129.1 hypothetical protein K493DRAFT_311123 [Basidiobolus meristosporus CBS 931.73]
MFETAANVVYGAAMIMTLIMIYHVKTKYTAVGRKEMAMFFGLYFLSTLTEILLISSSIPIASPVYPWIAALQMGLISGTIWCLFINGLISFQFFEDGTKKSLWAFCISTMAVIAGVLTISIFTFESPNHRTYQTILWFFYFVFNGACILLYLISQLIFLLKIMRDRWALGCLLSATLFFCIGQLILYTASNSLCKLADHYIDGVFFGALCTLLAVMMLYKYWDSITREDLEFSVGSPSLPDWSVDKKGYSYA